MTSEQTPHLPSCTGLTGQGFRCGRPARYRVRAAADSPTSSRACAQHLAQIITDTRAPGMSVVVDVVTGWMEGERDE